ncbi:MAG: hypothetical protein M3Q76_13540 [Acidobacteriota bacterium]|nr:hypothetical protein [Acidobacteriota bacterium]
METASNLEWTCPHGRVLVSNTHLLALGPATFRDVNADRFLSPGSSRLELRAIATADLDVNEILFCVMPTVEMYNNESGGTSPAVPVTLRRFTHLPDPHGAP